jgi:hypothetical protein
MRGGWTQDNKYWQVTHKGAWLIMFDQSGKEDKYVSSPSTLIHPFDLNTFTLRSTVRKEGKSIPRLRVPLCLYTTASSIILWDGVGGKPWLWSHQIFISFTLPTQSETFPVRKRIHSTVIAMLIMDANFDTIDRFIMSELIK